MNIYKCKKCGKKVSGRGKSGLCKSCVQLGKIGGMLGKTQSKESRNKISETLKGKVLPKSHKLNISKSLKGRKLTKQHRENIKNAWNKPEVKLKISGENNGFYVNGQGRFPYASEFTPYLKKEIIKRDNYKCQCCGMTQEEHYEKYGRDIEIHHIDHCPDNCNKTNLITLCHKCNMGANSNMDYWFAFYNYIMEEK
jgi:predicted HNH restriction endonuclease